MPQTKNSNTGIAVAVCVAFFCLLFFLASEVALADGNSNQNQNAPAPVTAEQVAAILADNKKLKERLDALENGGKKKGKKDNDESKDENDDDQEDGGESDDDGLAAKAAKERDQKAKRIADDKRLEAAILFNTQSEKFIKEHETILPKTMADIFKAADKEKYDSQIEKANAIKSALVSEFFKLQAHLDILTETQRNAVEDFEKLSKRGREEKAEEIFVNIFEPTLNQIKAVKKAEDIGKARNGETSTSDAEKNYIARIVQGSRSYYLGEKHA